MQWLIPNGASTGGCYGGDNPIDADRLWGDYVYHVATYRAAAPLEPARQQRGQNLFHPHHEVLLLGRRRIRRDKPFIGPLLAPIAEQRGPRHVLTGSVRQQFRHLLQRIHA